MPSDTRVFISHAQDDTRACFPLVAALDAWEISYFFDSAPAGTTAILPAPTQQALTESNVFIRVCTRHTSASSIHPDEPGKQRLSRAPGAAAWQAPHADQPHPRLRLPARAVRPFYAVDIETTKQVWTFSPKSNVELSSGVLYNDKIYISSLSKYLYVLDRATGNVLHTYQTGGRIHTRPTIANGIVYVGCEDHYLYAFNAV